MKKLFGLMICLIVIGTALSWAGGSAETGVTDDQITLTKWTFVDPQAEGVRSQAHRHVHETFMEKYPNIRLDVNVIGWQQLDPMLIRVAAGGESPDIAMIYHPSLLMHVEAGSIRPLDPYLRDWSVAEKADFVAPWESTVFDGQKWAFHYEHRVTGMMYRRDLLEQHGLAYPNSMAELVQFSQRLNNPPELLGWLTGVNSRNPMAVMERAMPLVYAEGGILINPDGTAAIATDPWVKVVEFWRDLVHVHRILPQDQAIAHTDETQSIFIAGNGLFYVQPSHRLGFTRDRSGLGNDIAFGPIPAFEPGTTAPVAVFGWMLVVPKNSRHPEAATKFIEHYVSPEIQAYLAEVATYIPVRKSVLDHPWFATEDAADIRNFVELASDNPLEPLVLPEHAVELFTMIGEVFEKAVIEPNTTTVRSELTKVANEYNRRHVR